MTFAALLVIQKREKGKVSLSISRANNVRPCLGDANTHASHMC